MTTQAVSLNMGVGAAKQNTSQSQDNGFSQALGNVDSGRRKQAGCQDPGGSQRRQETSGSENGFSYTQKASEARPKLRQPDDGARDQGISESGETDSTAYAYDSTADKSFTELADDTLKEAAKLLDEAVKSVRQEAESMAAQGHEQPAAEELFTMVLDALEKLRKDNEENKDVDEAIEAMTAAIAAVAEDGSVRALIVDGGEKESSAPVTVTASVETMSARLRTFSEKSGEIAMLGGEQIHDGENDQTAVYGNGDETILNVQTQVQQTAEGSVTEMTQESPDSSEAQTYTENSAAQQTLPAAQQGEELALPQESDAQTVQITQQDHAAQTAALADDSAKTSAAQDNGTVQAENAAGAQQDAMKLLSELLRQAKKELGLSAVTVRHLGNAQDETQGKIFAGEEHVRMSLQMNKSDRSGELDYILSGGREGSEKSAQTQTYDAVHMAQQLMDGRTDASIKPEMIIPEAHTEQPAAPEVQTVQQIIERMGELRERQQTEFTMVLNPESLGRITVKLVSAGEKVAVQITAENPDTGRLLAERTENMQSMLRDSGVQLERYQIVTEGEDTQELMQQNYDGSSKNPYSNQRQAENSDEDGEDFYDILNSL